MHLRSLQLALLLSLSILAVNATQFQGLGDLHILVTNDDGYNTTGIDTLVKALQKSKVVGKITVVAPLENKTGTGDNTTFPNIAGVNETRLPSGYPATAINGFPADCVLYALDVMKLQPDIVVSGINIGMNVGKAACISGTLGAARTAALRGIPSVALSQQRWNYSYIYTDFSAAAKEAVSVVEMLDAAMDLLLLEVSSVGSGLPNNIQSIPDMISVNIPICNGTAPCIPLQVKNAVQTGEPPVYPYPAWWPPNITNDVEAVAAGYVAETQLRADKYDLNCTLVFSPAGAV